LWIWVFLFFGGEFVLVWLFFSVWLCFLVFDFFYAGGVGLLVWLVSVLLVGYCRLFSCCFCV